MRRRRLYALLPLVFGPLLALAAPQTFQSAPGRVALLELYTSEGCSSCPPADRWLSSLVGDARVWREVVPLAFHVDYWDYIGWTDRFASPAHAARQRAYRRLGRVGSVYTPGFVVNGREWAGWFGRPKLRLGQPELVGALGVVVEDGGVDVLFTPLDDAREGLLAHVALLGFGLLTRVAAGENEGRTLSHDFVVLGTASAPLRASPEGLRASLELPRSAHPSTRLAVAAWVSSGDDPTPVQATGGWLPRSR